MKWYAIAALFSSTVAAQGEMVELYPNAYIQNGHCSIVTDKNKLRADLTLAGEIKDEVEFKVKRKIILNDHADKIEVYANLTDYEIEYEEFDSNQRKVKARDTQLWINDQVVRLDQEVKGQATNTVSMNMKSTWNESDVSANQLLRNTVELEVECNKHEPVKMEVCDLAFSFFPNKAVETPEYRAERQELLNNGKIGNTRIFKIIYGGYWCPDTFEPDTDSPF